jgi:hypothetical protein
MYQEIEVDLLCIGSGPAALTAAIASACVGLKAWVADTDSTTDGSGPAAVGGTWVEALRCRLGSEALSSYTRWYLHVLTRDLAPPVELPAQSCHSPRMGCAPSRRRNDDGTVEPFFGAELKQWARECLLSPYGFILSPVHRQSATQVLLDGMPIEAVAGPALTAGQLSGLRFRDWLLGQVRSRSIPVCAASPLRQLLFSGGQVVGARIEALDGRLLEIRAARGVLLSTAGPQTDVALPPYPLSPDTPVAVSLITRTASRFGRLELLTDGGAIRDIDRTATTGVRLPSDGHNKSRPHGQLRTRAKSNG